MSEWWTYRPSDFLMFAPDTYWRQFELHNEALWPYPALAGLLALAWAVALQAAPERRRLPLLRGGLVALAAMLPFVAWAFLWQRYAEINWAAQGFAVGFAGASAALLTLAVWPSLAPTDHRRGWRVGLGLVLWAALVHPLLPLLASAPLAQAEWLGAAPDPTVLATLGLLLCVQTNSSGVGVRAGRWLLVLLRTLALGWCAISTATLWTMGSAQGWVMATLAALGLWAWGARPRKA